MAVECDPNDLDRFVAAQQPVFERALAEIRNGRKRSHWMWFIFPQLLGLGHSEMSRRHGVVSMAEARAYLAHPVLGPRLRIGLEAIQDLVETSVEEVFGRVDAMKLRSSLTLFIEAGGGALFEAVLGRWFSGVKDPETLRLIEERQ